MRVPLAIALASVLTAFAAAAPAGAVGVPAGAGSPAAESEAIYARIATIVAQRPPGVAHTDAQRQALADSDEAFTASMTRYENDLGVALKTGRLNQQASLELTAFANYVGYAYITAHKLCDHPGALENLQVARVYLNDFRAGSPQFFNPDGWTVPGLAAASARNMAQKSFCAP